MPTRSNLVSVPYEITLLSNCSMKRQRKRFVSVPYEITLLSNDSSLAEGRVEVSVPYEITLLSNIIKSLAAEHMFQYLMKLHYSQTPLC